MKVDLFTLRFAGGNSFYARVANGTPVAIVDAFCVLESGELPVAVGMCSVAIKMQFERAEAGTKQIQISFLDQNGKCARPSLENTVEVNIPDHEPTAIVPFAFLIKQLSLPAFGEYSVDLSVDGRLAATTPLYVRQKANG
jgi:hypothetical protein